MGCDEGVVGIVDLGAPGDAGAVGPCVALSMGNRFPKLTGLKWLKLRKPRVGTAPAYTHGGTGMVRLGDRPSSPERSLTSRRSSATALPLGEALVSRKAARKTRHRGIRSQGHRAHMQLEDPRQLLHHAARTRQPGNRKSMTRRHGRRKEVARTSLGKNERSRRANHLRVGTSSGCCTFG